MGNQLGIVRIHDQGVGNSRLAPANGSGSARRGRRCAPRRTSLGDQVHAVVEGSDSRQVRGAVKALDLLVAVVGLSKTIGCQSFVAESRRKNAVGSWFDFVVKLQVALDVVRLGAPIARK